MLTEKPISVRADAQQLIDHLAHPELVFSAVFNQRTDPHSSSGADRVGERNNQRTTDHYDLVQERAYYRSGLARDGQAKAAASSSTNARTTWALPVACRMPAITAIGGIGKYHT